MCKGLVVNRLLSRTFCYKGAKTLKNFPLCLRAFVAKTTRWYQLIFLLAFLNSCAQEKKQFDVVIRNGTVYDGSGNKPYIGDVAINADTLAAIGDLSNTKGKEEIDAKGLAVSPGFINMLSWADGSLLKDGRSMSDIKQGVTLEVFGEGWSPGPRKRKNEKDSLWSSLGEYFQYLQNKKVSPNFASFVGATTVRDYVLGHENRKPTVEELEQMKELVRTAMQEGAMGLGSSLIYAPADYASTEELIALSKVVSHYGGLYISYPQRER